MKSKFIKITKIFSWILFFLIVIFVINKKVLAGNSDITGKVYMNYNNREINLPGVIIQKRSKWSSNRWSTFKTNDQGVYHMEGNQSIPVFNADFNRLFTPYPDLGAYADRCGGYGENKTFCYDDNKKDLNSDYCGANCGEPPIKFIAFFPDNYDITNFPNGVDYRQQGHWVLQLPSDAAARHAAKSTSNVDVCQWEKQNNKYYVKYWADGQPKFTLGDCECNNNTCGSSSYAKKDDCLYDRVANGQVYSDYNFEWVLGQPTQSTITPKPGAKAIQAIAVPTTAPRNKGITGSRSGYSWKCLKAEQVTNGREGELKLKNTSDVRFPIDRDVYIVGCVPDQGVFKCTTGKDDKNNNSDAFLNIGISNANNYSFKVIGNNPRQLPNGLLDVNVISMTPGNITTHVFYGVYLDNIIPTTSSSSLQYGSFPTDQDFSKCIAIHWDP